LSDIARTIGAAIVGSGTGSGTYRSPDAKKDFAALSAPVLLSDEKLDVQILALKQEMLPELAVVALSAIEIDGLATSLTDFAKNFLTTSRELSLATVESEIIARFSDNPDISEWVEQGFHIHKEHSSTKCEYCDNTISPERLSQLAKHYSDADRLLKARLDDLIAKLRSTNTSITQLSAHDSARFYRELSAPCETAVSNMEKAKTLLISQVTALGKLLQEKKSKTGDKITLNLSLEVDGLVAALDEINKLVGAHNIKSKYFQTLQNAAVKEIKAHYLSTIFADVSARNLVIADLEKDLERRIAEIKEVKARITDARAKISSTHKACEQINDSLKTFLGRDELRFAPETKVVKDEAGNETEIVSGYRIMRGTAPASYLSEGEKTAIAFVYFVVHLNDGQFQKATGIVVIDDPISSLDSNSLYQAFSFLKNAVADCSQVFVLTHNFDFLKLLLNWRRGARKKHTGFYMIRNHFVGAERRASIDEMDRELKDYESEYHYLFKRLKEMRAEQDGTLMRAYLVPNIARKVWDTFLMFRVPDGQDNYSKMDQLKEAGFDALKLDAIYKFTNSQSHITGGGFDPSLVPETQKVLDELFEMMKLVSPEHFAILDKATA
jgi:wobble nucleotide-excising tRNase